MSVFSDLIAEKMQSDSHLNIPKDDFSTGALISAVMSIGDAEQATAFYEGYVEWTRDYQAAHPEVSQSPVTEVVRSNIGWCFGEGMDPQRVEMWVTVCDARHPFFGVTKPTADEAFEAGVAAGEAMLHGES